MEITGRFDFPLQYARDSAVPSDEPSGPSIFTALQEQLGLKLGPSKAYERLLKANVKYRFSIDMASLKSE
jgi:uncharacterized protein (TIGR03435 family)